MAPYQWKNDNLILSLYLQPNARQDKVIGLFNDLIKIQISAPAIDNKANNHLKKWLAKAFHVPNSHIILLKGEHTRQKIVQITRPEKIPPWLKNLT